MDMLCCALTVDMTDDQLKEAMHCMAPRVRSVGYGFLVSITGYAKDPRELWEIPECIEFFKRLVDLGFISLLEPVAQVNYPGTAGFGALEVWMVATGQITKRAKYPITQELVLRLFNEILPVSNAKLEAVLAAPRPKTDICEREHIIGRGDWPVPDGQHQRKKKDIH